MSIELPADSDLMKRILAGAVAGLDPKTAPNGDSYVLHPEGTIITRYTAVNPTLPADVRASHNFIDVRSFADYTDGFRTDSAKMFCDIDSRVIRAVLDYHRIQAGSAGVPARCGHSADLRPQLSVEWKAWAAVNEAMLSQHDFAEFLEENAVFIAEPDAATILEVVQGLSVKTVVDIDSAINLGNGNVQFKYSEEGTAKVKGREIIVPTKLVLHIPIFTGGTRQDVNVLFRYRAKDGLKFMIKIVRKEQVLLDAFRRLVSDAAAATGLTPLFTV